jgi:DNA invertase Pin-like site-specific DNA recombinase
MSNADDNGAAIPVVMFAAKSTEDPHGSIDGQLAKCREAIEREGGREIVAEFSDEAASGYRGNRGPGLQAAMERAEELGAELWIVHTDRLARGDGRTAKHLVEYVLWAMKADVTLRSVEDPDACRDILYAALNGQRNNEDSRRKSAATRDGKRRRFERGESTGRLHDGYMRVPRLDANGEPVEHPRTGAVIKDRIPDPERAPIIQRIFALFDEGYGPGEIARTLNGEGLRTRNGKTWTARRIRSTVADVYYAGWVGTGGGRDKPHAEVREGNHEAIIDRELFVRVQSKIKRLDPVASEARKGGRPPHDDYLLKRIATCARCGRAMYTRRYADVGRAYLCGSVREARGTCDLPRIPASVIERAVIDDLHRIKTSMAELLAKHAADHGERRDALAAEVERRRETLAVLDRRIAKLDALADAALDSDDDAATALRKLGRAEAEREAARTALDDAQAALDEFAVAPDVDAVTMAVERIGEVVAGHARRADGVATLNVALRELFASCEVEVDDDRRVAWVRIGLNSPVPTGDGMATVALATQGRNLDDNGDLPAWLVPSGPDGGDGEITGRLTKVNRCLAEGRKSFLERYAGIESGRECRRLAPALSALVDGEADAARTVELRAHLRQCLSCRAAVRGLHDAARPLEVVFPAAGLLVAGGGAEHTGSFFVRVYETVTLHLHERAANSFLRAQAVVDTVTAGKMAAVAASAAAVAGGGFAVEGAMTARDDRPTAVLRGVQGLASVPIVAKHRPQSRTHARRAASAAKKPKARVRVHRQASAPPAARPPAVKPTTSAPRAVAASTGGSSHGGSAAAGEFGFEGP